MSHRVTLIFSPTHATCTRLPACCPTTSVGLLPTYSPILPSQTAIVSTPTCVQLPHLASQDVKVKSYLSVVIDDIPDTRASLENVSVSLINEINTILLHPSWVKHGDVVTSPTLGARMFSSNVSLGVNDSQSPLQDLYEQPEEYNFDPDPGTRNNDFRLQSLRAICPLFYITSQTFNLPQLLVALTGYQ